MVFKIFQIFFFNRLQKFLANRPLINHNLIFIINHPYFRSCSSSSSSSQKKTFDRVSSAPVAPGEQVMSEIERIVEKAKHEEEVEQINPADPLLEYFQRADEILKTDFVWQKEQPLKSL